MPKTVAMVLAGGRVNELEVLTFLRPKSTVPFGGLYRFIDFPLSNLMNSGIERVGILSQYRSSSLIEHIGTGASWDMLGRHRGITLLPPFQGMHESDWYKGTADAVYQNLDFLHSHKPDFVLIVSGDHIYHMNYQDLIEFHMDMHADVSCAFVDVPISDASRFGLGRIANDDYRGGRLVEYSEKPKKPISTWASMTTYLFRMEVLEEVLAENAKMDSHEFGRDIFPALLGRFRVYGYRFYGYWAYSRTLDEYWQANMDLLGKNPKINLSKWLVRTNLDHEAIRDRGPALVDFHNIEAGGARDTRFYNGVRIEGNVEHSILFPGVHVEAGASVRDSILFFDTQVGPGAQVERTITDIGVSIGKNCTIGAKGAPLTVIGTRTQVPQGVKIGAGSSLHPELQAEHFMSMEYPPGTVIGSERYAKPGPIPH